MRIYANIESNESISYLKNYDPDLSRIEMSSETKSILPTLENSSVADWLNTHNIANSTTLGFGIICGVVE